MGNKSLEEIVTMETKLRFKNSFGVMGTITEIELFAKEIRKLGWIHSEEMIARQRNYLPGTHLFLYSDGHLYNGNYFTVIEYLSLSTLEGWKRAISLAEEKEEEVPEGKKEYWKLKNKADDLYFGRDYEFGKVYHESYMPENILVCHPLIFILKNWPHKWEVACPETNEDFIRQELLEEAKIRYPIGTRYKSCGGFEHITDRTPMFWGETNNIYAKHNAGFIYDVNIKWAEIITEPTLEKVLIESVEMAYKASIALSEALKETLNKIKK